jgi:GntR family transcriptional regulator, transcriptional repressor for pyruvate dehydrogenase complex
MPRMSPAKDGALLTPLDVKKRYVLVMNQILDLIKRGVYREGDILPPERVIASRMGISRPSVREAYSALEIAGILESRVGSGTYVKSASPGLLMRREIRTISAREESPYEIFEVRKILEMEAVALAARHAEDRDVAALKGILGEMKGEIRRGASYTLGTDALFHLKIAEMSRNSMLLNVLRYVLDYSKERLWKLMRARLITLPGHKEKDIAFHAAIVRSIELKDGVRARSLMNRHFTQLQKELRS